MLADPCLAMPEEALALEPTLFPATKKPAGGSLVGYCAWLWQHDVEQLDLLSLDTETLWSTVPAITLEFVTHAYYIYMVTGKDPAWFFREMPLTDATHALWLSLKDDYKWFHSHMSMYYNVFFNEEASHVVTWGDGVELWKPRTYVLRPNAPCASITACFGSADHWRLGGVDGIGVPVKLMRKVVHPAINAVFQRLLNRSENQIATITGLLQFQRLKNKDFAGRSLYRVHAGPNRYMRRVASMYVGKLMTAFEMVDHGARVHSGSIGCSAPTKSVGCESLSMTPGVGDVESMEDSSFSAPGGFFPKLSPHALQDRGLSLIRTHLNLVDVKLRLQLTTNILDLERREVEKLREDLVAQRYLIEGLSDRFTAIENATKRARLESFGVGDSGGYQESQSTV